MLFFIYIWVRLCGGVWNKYHPEAYLDIKE